MNFLFKRFVFLNIFFVVIFISLLLFFGIIIISLFLIISKDLLRLSSLFFEINLLIVSSSCDIL